MVMSELNSTDNLSKKMGRPLSFNTAEELWHKCLEYFILWKEQNRPYTVVGLAGFLNVGKDTFWEYGRGTYDHVDCDFSDTVKKAREYIETYKWEKMLTGEYKTAGAIFDLKNNHGAKDTIEHLTKDGAAINSSNTIINNLDLTNPQNAAQLYNDTLKEIV
jgi:hypothetical protein